MGMMPIHQRIAELWTVNKRRPLTPDEMAEMQHCLTENAKLAWKIAHLENLSLMASMTNDMEWLHDICREIDDLQAGIKTKKPGPKKGPDKKN